MKAASLLVAALLTAGAVADPAPLVPWRVSDDIAADSIVDLSGLNGGPVGADDAIRLSEDGAHLVNGRGERVRLFGCNMSLSAALPSEERAAAVAERLARLGYNCVRLHSLDNRFSPESLIDRHAGDHRHIDPVQLARLDRLAFELAQRGVHLDLNLHVNRRLDTSDGVASGEAGPNYNKGVDIYHPRMIALQQEYARQLLGHVNPHTGRRWADDPALALVEITNEDGLVIEWATGKIDTCPEPLVAPLRERWNAHLSARPEVRRLWADDASPVSVFPVPTITSLASDDGQRREAWLSFLADLEVEYSATMRRFLREDLGVSCPIIDTQVNSSPSLIQAEASEVVALNMYWDHPQFPHGAWDAVDWRIHNLPLTSRRGLTMLSMMASSRIAGKPFIVTEFNHAAPNDFGGEGFPLLAVMAGLQDWDGLFVFGMSRSRDDATDRFGTYFDIVGHPVKLVTAHVAARLFRRGLIAPGQPTEIPITRPREIDWFTRHRWESRLGALGLDPLTALRDRIGLLPEESIATPPLAPLASVVEASNRQITWDLSDPAHARVRVVAPGVRLFAGFLSPEETVTLGDVVLALGETHRSWATISLTSLDASGFDQSGRWLLTATGLCENTGMQWNADRTSVGRQWGSAPTLVETIPVSVTLPGEGAGIRAWALDGSGGRAAPLDTSTGTVTLGPENGTLWCEIEVVR